MCDAFAGVRDSNVQTDGSDLSCCVYGRSCTVFSDSDTAAALDSEQHLQPWLGDDTVMVDRYDVRLLWHDTMQLSRAARKRTADSSEQALEEELDYERYLDINQPARSESPPAAVSPQSASLSRFHQQLAL